jgi:hypothetical protein
VEVSYPRDGMGGMRAERVDIGQVSEFRLVGVADELVPGVRKCAFAEHEGYWARDFPAGSAQVDQAWAGFEALIEPCLRQAAGLDPVPWEAALELVCRRLTGAGVDWWLVGSGALAARGIAVEPGDLDLVVSGVQAHRVGELLVDGLIEPVAPVDWFCEWFGRAMLGARVEWVGGLGPASDEPEIGDFGLYAAARLEVVRWREWEIRVPPVALQRATSVRRELAERVRLIDAYAG